ncbi:hypothetical protein NDU88_004076 [Pleurodeles waltl]|uniref:Uncharacterized protein n=1 Tax=Pleurodeles waltl TaxID=8319 RepID=A0AAV7QBJ0_PLEWA|nr:hypothetical protein NDU88_004076 [Pleurodeles waltl]
MDASITSLTLETKSMRSDIAGFQSRVTKMEQRMGSLEAQATASQDQDQDLLYLRSKLTDMEDRSRRDNIRLLGIPKKDEGTDMQAFLSSTLSKLTSLDFYPPLEFQRAHSAGPKRSDKSSRARPIIACLLRHNQTRQILQATCSHGPFRVHQHDIRITTDYSKETNERRKAFLALRPRLRQLKMKYGLFDPARMWVTKNRVSKDFYNPEDLRLFLDSFQPQPMYPSSLNRQHNIEGDHEGNGTFPSGMEKANTALYDTDASQRGRDKERLGRSHDDRGPHVSPPPTEPTMMSDKDHSTTMERILQEITTVSRRIEVMDASITSLTLETKSMRSDIAGFQSRVTKMEQRMGSLEAQATASQDQDQDLLYLRSKLTDMEDRNRRDNIRLLGIPKKDEGTDMQAFLSSTLSKLTSLDFYPPLEFQRAHSAGPKRSDKSSRARPIIACLLRHNQTRQILQATCSHGPFRVHQHDIRITTDYSKETNERRKAFLALRPRLRQLKMKYGLFDPARMWVTKNRVSKDFYNPEDLRLFLDSFQPQPMYPSSLNRQHNIEGDHEGNGTFPSGMEKANTALYDTDASQRGRDKERLGRSHDDREGDAMLCIRETIVECRNTTAVDPEDG